MAFSNWLCTNSTKNKLVKIVHPGGHVELHDRPVLAAEIMLRNPRCCVAHPHVFKQPWAIVQPETTLMLGQKFYVVPVSTIRKLQRLSFKINSPNYSSPAAHQEFGNVVDRVVCNDGEQNGDDGAASKCFSDESCFMNLIAGGKTKANEDAAGEESRTSTSIESSRGLTRKMTKDFRRIYERH